MRFDFFGRLWVRLLVVTVTPVLIAVVSVGVLANYVTIPQFESFILQDTQQRDSRLEAILERDYREEGGWQNVNGLVQRIAPLIGERLVLADASGRVVADSTGQLLDRQQAESWRRPIPLIVDGARVGTVFINPVLPGRASTLQAEAFLRGVNHSLVIGTGIAAVAAILLTLLLSNRLRKELARLIRITREIGRGKLSLRIPADQHGDLRDLGAAINHMASDLEAQMGARQQMVADVAHELRNPLQNLNGYIEALKDGLLPADDRTLGILSAETDQLRRLVDDLQELSSMDSGRLMLESGPIDLAEEIGDVVELMKPRAEELGIALSGSTPELLPEALADRRRLRQVVCNLVSNAFAYTPRGGSVAIAAREGHGELEISVSDTGSGIAAEDQARIFERFYRVDPARARATGGAGLGLAIARELIQAMGGQIGVESRLGSGSRFWLRVPAFSAAGPEVGAESFRFPEPHGVALELNR